MRPPIARSIVCLAGVLLLMSGCSLITVESPVSPLSEHDLNARLATHRFGEHFSNQLRDTADRIAAESGEQSVLIQALRWKIGATQAIGAATFHTSPRDALVDTWVYCAQMAAFFRGGRGEGLFGAQQPLAVETSNALEADIRALALRFLPPAAPGHYEGFVDGYSADTPLEEIMAPRASSVRAFYEFVTIDEGEAVQTVGTLGQVVNDFGSRVATLSERLPRSSAWRTELFLLEQGIDGRSLQHELALFGSRIERVALVAEQTPDLVDSSLIRLQEELSVLIEKIGEERAAAVDALGRERAIVVQALSEERVAILAEVERYLDELTGNMITQLSTLAGTLLFGLAALVAVLFGVPFGIGVLVGRLSARGA